MMGQIGVFGRLAYVGSYFYYYYYQSVFLLPTKIPLSVELRLSTAADAVLQQGVN